MSKPILALLLALAALPVQTAMDAPLPATLSGTGLFEPGSVDRVLDRNVAFEPHYPLWTDGQSKRRWLYLPPGTAIDKSDPDRWEFPRGTRAWKEFSAEGRIETRMIERLADGTWRFSSYAWNAEGTEATLAPERGIPARGIPSRTDCLACHEGAPAPILGYSAVQLEGLKHARNEGERAALGYLHANCGHCHNANALDATGLYLAQGAVAPEARAAKTRESAAARAEVLRATLDAIARYQPAGAGDAVIVAPGRPEASLLASRMQSRHSQVQMPPLGTQLPDPEGLALIQRWIAQLDSSPREETSP